MKEKIEEMSAELEERAYEQSVSVSEGWNVSWKKDLREER